MQALSLGLRAPYRLKRWVTLLAQASLRLDFTKGGPLDSRVTFTRASGGTSFRPVGRGALVNQLTYSGNFGDAAWNAFGTYTRTLDASAGPNGDAAWRITATASPGVSIRQHVATSATVTLAVAYKAGTFNPNGWLVRNVTTSTNLASTATFVGLPNGWTLLSLVVTSGITIGNTLSLYFGAASGIAEGLYWFLHRGALFDGTYTAQQILDNGGIPLTFTSADNLLRLDRPGDPIQLFTAPANVPRMDYDPVTWQCKGLLVEEQRTNSVQSSETQVAGASLSCSGLVSALSPVNLYRWVSTTNGQARHEGLDTVVAAGATRTASAFFKKDVSRYFGLSIYDGGNTSASFDTASEQLTLSGAPVISGASVACGFEKVATGVYRIWLTYKAGSSASVTGFKFGLPSETPDLITGAVNGVSSVLLGGFQVEDGAFPTTYIPTTGAAATRAADVASVNTLSPWYNPAEGTLFVDFTHTNTDIADRVVFSLQSTSWVNNALHLRTYASSCLFAGYNGATQEVNVSLGAIQQENRIAAAFAANNFAACRNGGAIAADTSGTVPPVSALMIGTNGTTGQRNGHIRRVAFWPRRMSNLDLQGLTR